MSRSQKRERSVEELAQEVNISIPEAMRLMRKSRRWIYAKLKSGELRWFEEGDRKRIITKSIFEWQDEQVRKSMGLPYGVSHG